MKKLLIILFFSVFLFTQNVVAQAQVPACPPVPTLGMPLPGINCGNTLDPCNNRCCVYPSKQAYKKVDIPVISGVLNAFGISSPELWFIDTPLTFQPSIDPCSNGTPSTPGDLNNTGCVCIKPTTTPLNSIAKMCADIKNSGEKGQCMTCLGGVGQEVGVWTSVGCVRSNLSSFIQETLLGWGIGIAGGVSMLCIMYAAFMMQTSSGNAEKIKKAQQLMTSCITGLMVIIFSVFILQLIGVKILRIPGFN